MKFPSFSKIKDAGVALEQLIKFLKNISLLQGAEFSVKIEKGSDAVVIYHGMKRKVNWIMTNTNQPVVLYEDYNNGRILILKSNATVIEDCYLSIWVY